MGFYKKLEDLNIPESEKRFLPKSYSLVGKVLVLRLNKRVLKYKKKIGKACLHILPYVHTVVLEKGIEGKTRKPSIEILAGCKEHGSTQTIMKEHGCQFLLDVSKVMWSKGNKSERERMMRLAKGNETVVDMFAGIGYFSIFLAKKAKKVFAIEINPEAVEYLQKNVWLNNVENKIEILQGDNRRFASLLENTADRIVMGYLKETEKFLPYALKIAKNKAIIHFHKSIKLNEKEKLKSFFEMKNMNLIGMKIIKSVAPHVFHVVFDLRVEKS